MKKYLFFLLLGCIALRLNAQWSSTPSPVAAYRHDDVFFLNPDLGWAVNYSNGNDGYVIRTTNGGASWQKQVDSSGAKFRDISFLDSLTGFIGTLQTGYNPGDTIIMYKTTDGGTTWSGVPGLPGPRPGGICGMFAVNDTTLYACGRYYGPAGFYKTTDKGTTWSYKSFSGLAGGIVDLHFFNKDTGIAVGGTSASYLTGKGRILGTTDGGLTWNIVHTSAHTKELCWKISFPSRNIGYISMESFRGSGPQYFLKTTDGGLTWTDMPFIPGGTYDAEGIGFMNDSTGWIGGDPFNYKTTDGGLTWSLDNFGTLINRFRFFGDTLGYAAGKVIYKYQAGAALNISEPSAGSKNPLIYPNPSSGTLTIQKNWDFRLHSTLLIFDSFGREVYSKELNSLEKETLQPGLSEGIYFYQVRLSDGKSWGGKLVALD
ncbi:MAG: hypothetical protein JWO44_2797 [Bacteroidetes bacterium]|nr:hypothetical protein [Bacteroidota bacterium]